MDGTLIALLDCWCQVGLEKCVCKMTGGDGLKSVKLGNVVHRIFVDTKTIVLTSSNYRP